MLPPADSMTSTMIGISSPPFLDAPDFLTVSGSERELASVLVEDDCRSSRLMSRPKARTNLGGSGFGHPRVA